MKSTSLPISIQHIAKLANLNLSDEQLESFEQKIQPILGQMQELSALDLSNVPLTARVIEEENVLREDVVGTSLTQDAALQNAKQTHDGYFMVDAILENRES